MNLKIITQLIKQDGKYKHIAISNIEDFLDLLRDRFIEEFNPISDKIELTKGHFADLFNIGLWVNKNEFEKDRFTVYLGEGIPTDSRPNKDNKWSKIDDGLDLPILARAKILEPLV